MNKKTIVGAPLVSLQAGLCVTAHAQAAPAKPPVLLPPAGRDTPFPDVPKDHWAYQAVEAVRKAGIIVGYPAAAPPPHGHKPQPAKPRG